MVQAGVDSGMSTNKVTETLKSEVNTMRKSEVAWMRTRTGEDEPIEKERVVQ